MQACSLSIFLRRSLVPYPLRDTFEQGGLLLSRKLRLAAALYESPLKAPTNGPHDVFMFWADSVPSWKARGWQFSEAGFIS